MKYFLSFASFFVLVVQLATAQVTLVRYDFTTAPYTTATTGPDGLYINPDVAGDGTAVSIANNCGNNVGIDLMVPNDQAILDQGSLGMKFGWRKFENFADFFEREDFRFYVQNGFLWVQYATNNPNSGNSSVRGPFNTGHFTLSDLQFHEYAFEYQATTGEAIVLVDGVQVWSDDGPDGRPLSWLTGADAIIGGIMDGTCTGPSILDYAELYIPANPLPVEFADFQARNRDHDVELTWTTSFEVNNAGFAVERADDSGDFAEVAWVNAQSPGADGMRRYTVTDRPLNAGSYAYRIRQVDLDGQTSYSSIERVRFEPVARATATAFPNPTQRYLKVYPAAGAREIVLSDLQGRILRQSPLAGTDNVATLDLAELPSGYYLLQAGGTPLRIAVR